MANPVLDAYIKGVDESRQNGLANVQQAALLTQLVGAAKKQQLDQAYRSDLDALGPNPQPDALRAVALKYGGPKEIISSEDTRARIKATQESTLGRIQQQANQFDQMMQLRLQNAKDANEQRAIQNQWQQGRLNLQAASLRLAGAKLYDETGIKMGIPDVPQVSQTPAQDALAGRPQNEQDAIRMIQGANAAGQNLSVATTPGGPPVVQPPFQAATPVPAPPPEAPLRLSPQAPDVPQSVPQTPATMSMQQSGGLEGRFPPVGQPAEAAPAAPLALAPQASPQPSPQSASQTPEMPPEIKAAPPKVQRQWLLQATKPSIAGGGTFTPETLRFVARQYLTGDRQAVQGFSRSATARVQLQNAIVEEATAQGMSPEQVASKIADFAGTMSAARTVGQRAGQISLAANEAQEMIKVVKESSDEFKRTDFVPWNMALRAYETNTGSPEIAKFGASLNALVNVYARAINPTGQPTFSDKEHARAVLNSVQSPAQVDAVLGIINRELEIAKKAPQTVSAARTASITGGTRPLPGPVKITNDDDYNKLPPNSQFIGPDGKLRTKP